MRLVSAATIPAGAVMDTMELAADKTFEQRGIRQTMHHPKVGDYVMSGWPVRFSGETPPVRPRRCSASTMPRCWREWLKLDKDQIGALRNDSVVG